MSEPEIRLVPVSSLRPAPWNPRTIEASRFENLKQSIKADPDFMSLQPIVAMADGTIVSGNMRYRAAVSLGMETVPAILDDMSAEVAKRRAIVANHGWGTWDDELLPEFLVEMAADGVDLSLLGFEDKELERIMAMAGIDGGDGSQPEPAKITCPECGASWVPAKH